MTIGEAIRLIRTHVHKRATLRQDAARLGISHVHLCRIESGQSGVSVELLGRIYEVYGYHPTLLALLAGGVDLGGHAELLAKL